MGIIKRVFLFGIVNILILITISIFISILQTLLGFDIESGTVGLLVFALMFGMGGAFISLWMSKFMAKKWMGVQVIDKNTSNPRLQKLLNKVAEISKDAGLPVTPELGVYQSHDMNAFATGPSKKNSLVAVSSAVLEKMNDSELEGLLGHEVAHIANGDMVTMTLLQGIVNTLVIFFARIIAHIITSQLDEEASIWTYMGIVILLQIVLGFFGIIIVNTFSRHREYRADYGSSKLVGSQKMILALKALANEAPTLATEGGRWRQRQSKDNAFKSLQISSPQKKAFWHFAFATHPSLESRIARLERVG